MCCSEAPESSKTKALQCTNVDTVFVNFCEFTQVLCHNSAMLRLPAFLKAHFIGVGHYVQFWDSSLVQGKGDTWKMQHLLLMLTVLKVVQFIPLSIAV